MPLVTVKGREKGIELCFLQKMNLREAEEELSTIKEKNNGFFSGVGDIFYSGTDFDYFEEVKFSKLITKIFGKRAVLHKHHKLSNGEIKHSLDENESICTTIHKNLRCGDVVKVRGDLIVYGDVNPGATVCANGNITVIGALRGTAQTRNGGRVYATFMQPMQIRIGNVCSYCKKNKNVGSAVAMAEKGEIILQTL